MARAAAKRRPPARHHEADKRKHKDSGGQRFEDTLFFNRIRKQAKWVFVLLILAAEIHAMVGLYRILVKWSWIHRKKFTNYLVYATIFFVGLGFLTLLVFYFRSIPKGLS